MYPALFHSTLSTLYVVKTPDLFVTFIGVVFLFIFSFFFVFFFFHFSLPRSLLIIQLLFLLLFLLFVVLFHSCTLKVSTYFVVLLALRSAKY